MSHSRDQVEEKLAELIARLDASENGARALGESLPDPRVLALHVTDLSADYWTELAAGRIGQLHDAVREDADIRITADSDDLVGLIDGRASLFSAYLAGRVRIDASFGDLLRLRRLVS
jgi:predicted lipid carrier protein YhbT